MKDLVFDNKKLTMAELKTALAANFEGEYEKVRKMCFEAPKHGNDIPEVNKLVHRVNDSVLHAFENVDGGGNYISKDIKTSLDQYTKSIHNMMGLVTGALPTSKKAGVALTDGSLSAMPGTDVNGPTALVVSAATGDASDHVIKRSGQAAEAVARGLQLLLIAEEAMPLVLGPWVRGGVPTAVDRQQCISHLLRRLERILRTARRTRLLGVTHAPHEGGCMLVRARDDIYRMVELKGKKIGLSKSLNLIKND